MNPLRTVLALGILFVGGFFIVTSLTVSPPDYANIALGMGIAVAGFIFIGRSMGRGSREKQFAALDLVAVVLIAVFFLSSLLADLSGLLGNAQMAQNISIFLLLMQVGGLTMALISGVLRISTAVTALAFRMESLYIIANFGSFFILDLIVPPSTPILLRQSITTGSPFVTVMISVPEETVFHVWLAPWLANVSHTGPLGGSFMQAIIAAAYHFFAYGTNPALLGIVFGAFFVAGFTAMKSKLASTTIANHLFNNALSVGVLRV